MLFLLRHANRLASPIALPHRKQSRHITATNQPTYLCVHCACGGDAHLHARAHEVEEQLVVREGEQQRRERHRRRPPKRLTPAACVFGFFQYEFEEREISLIQPQLHTSRIDSRQFGNAWTRLGATPTFRPIHTAPAPWGRWTQCQKAKYAQAITYIDIVEFGEKYSVSSPT